MPAEGKPQVMTFSRNVTSPNFGSAPIEMGAKGFAVELFAAHYFVENAVGAFNSHFALSSNPEHELTPPPTTNDFLSDPAIYGHSGSEIASTFLTSMTRIIPLYGIIRPRRQILVWVWDTATATNFIRAEIYYRLIELGKTELDTLNLKYGKYRRHF